MKLLDLPRPIPVSSYTETREAITEKYRGLPGVNALLEFGTIPHPGISDMDFFVIVEPGVPVLLPHFSEYTEEQRFAMVHRHFVLSKRLFRFINEFDPWFVAVQALYDPGQQYTFQKEHFPPDEYEVLSLNFIYQKLVYGCLPLLADIKRTGTLSCRAFFEEIKLFQYFLREFRKLSIECGDEDPALGSYRTLAEQWFSLSAQEQQQRMEETLEHYARSIASIARILFRRLASLPSKPLPRPFPPQTRLQQELLTRFPESFILDTGTRVFVYEKNSTELSIEATKSRTLFRLPLCFACFSTTHLTLRGCLSDFYQAHACTDLSSLPRFEHPRLTSLFTHANENLWETRDVRNGKYYEITYGNRPPSSSLLRRARQFLPSLPSRLMTSLFQEEGTTETLWSSDIMSR